MRHFRSPRRPPGSRARRARPSAGLPARPRLDNGVTPRRRRGRSSCQKTGPITLRQLLRYAHEDESVGRLAAATLAAAEPQRAFVSSSLRPYLLAALLDAEPARPALVVAGDDRSARDLAADLKVFLAPRRVRFYPSRGVRYESHLAPAPHLVGLRVAALDALLSQEHPAHGAAVVVASAPALAEKVPDPALRPQGFAIERGGLLDVEETADRLVACGYQRTDQVEDRGQFALRGDILDVYPATEDRAVRCELFDVEVERLTFFSTFTQRSLEEVTSVEIAPAAELGPEHRELAEIAALEDESERPDVAELLPVDRFRELLSLLPADALVAVAAEEEVEQQIADHWSDVTASFHDAAAHHLYVSPDDLRAALDRRACLRLSSISGDQPHAFRAQGADSAARSLREAEPELEKLVRSGYRTVVAWARRGEAERALQPRAGGRGLPRRPPGARRGRRPVRGSQPAGRLSGAGAEARDPAGAPPAPPPSRPAALRSGRGARSDRILHGPARRRRGRALRPRDRALHRL